MRCGARRVVGGVAVDQHVEVGLDVGEHAPHHVALALALFLEHLGAGGARGGRGIVGRIVVEHENRGRGQRRLEVAHDLGDRGFLVVAGHQHRDFVAVEPGLCALDRVPKFFVPP